MTSLQFAPWSSDLELSFYAALASLKINHDKLNDAARKVIGRYDIQSSDAPERSTRMQVHGNAFKSDDVPVRSCRAEGTIKNVNTVEEYKNLDRAAIMEQAGRTIWESILDGTIYSCPSLLASFYAIFFADLKKYRFTYHFAFPAIHSDPPWKATQDVSDQTRARLSAAESSLLFDAVQTWKYSVDKRQHGFFLAKRTRLNQFSSNESGELESRDRIGEAAGPRPQTPKTPRPEDVGFRWVVGALGSYEQDFFKDTDEEDRFVCFMDPSTYASNPGWMLRNLLVLIRQRWHLDKVQILCYRDTQARREQAHSLILHLSSSGAESATTTSPRPMPKVTGWERNESNKLTNRTVDLAEYMDPARLADQSVDLNLKLMKWRIAPGLDLDVVKDVKCLLLGAGTLGSYVSRVLLGWGVRKITLVDNGKVSFSNPVRQPLFNFHDCLDGGAQKATRAAAALKEIYPGVDATGHVMSVPMAGHPVVDEAKTKADFDLLKRLIDEHDAIFLLMDTRESRWLPTVMGKAAGKIVLNAALGFDTYFVMRHGAKPKEETPAKDQLGCWFCNDVVAPADSQKDATLDQQCTVTRPGAAPLASALLVELLVSILQHPAGQHAPAPLSRTNTGADPSASPSAPASSTGTTTSPAPSALPFTHPLGLVPHTIRGYMRTFDNVLLRGQAYESCAACSGRVLAAYEGAGWGFVRRACDERGYVERVSGLEEVQRRAEEAMREIEEMELSDGEGEGGDEEGELI